jgi:hypothetical protein
LKGAVKTLDEENQLLRDFTYNIDPNAKKFHEHKFNLRPSTADVRSNSGQRRLNVNLTG